MILIYNNKNHFMEFYITNSNHSYIIGLLQADGNISECGNKGKITLELSIKDKDILEKISMFLKCNFSIRERTRKILLKNKEYHLTSVCLSFFDLETRQSLKKYIPTSKKSDKIMKPENILENDYWRGIIDGDGSLGFTKNGIPYISLVTCSDILANQYVDFLEQIIGYKKITTKNKRDSAYNIMVTNENAQKIVNCLYYKDCLSINRKYNLAIDIMNWIRPIEKKKIDFSRKKWTKEEDDYILNNNVLDSMIFLERTKKSIAIRLYRLKNI